MVEPKPLPADWPTYQEHLDSLGISGYASTLSVEPGQTVDIMVSTRAPNFTSELVRITHGDADPKGPGIKEAVIESPANGEYEGQYQVLPLGSYVTVPDGTALDLDSDFTITAWIAPTTIPGSNLNPVAQDRTPVGTPRPQGIVSKWDEQAGSGYGLFVADDGSLALWIADAAGKVEKTRTGVRMNPYAPSMRSIEAGDNLRPMMSPLTTWYFVAASYDAETGEVTLYQQPLRDLPDPTGNVLTTDTDLSGLAANDAPLLLGAGWGIEQPDAIRKGGLFNGKIDDPRIYDRVLTAEELYALRADGTVMDGALAVWDFSKEMHGADVIDVVGDNDGVAVNLPVRAVTGHTWQPGTMDFKDHPEMYNAMYFHDDDIGDSQWESSVQYTLPEDAKSGIYAARLTAGDNIYHAVFTVRPKHDEPTAEIAFMVPTFSYLAYGSTGGSLRYSASQYSPHSDGSGVFYSSARRPIANMRPYATGRDGAGTPWQFEADTHITDWLDASGYIVDYITDHDVHREGASLLKDYKVVITGTHPEYISAQIWHALQDWLNSGGRLMYMGGNGYYWVTSLGQDGYYTELRRHDGTEAWQAPAGEYYHNTTGEFGGLWRFRGHPPQELVGVGFSAQGFSSLAGSGSYGRPYEVTEQGRSKDGAWIFAGVDTDSPIGDFPSLQNPGGPGGEELDRIDYSLGTPANTLVVAVSSGFGDEYVHVVEEVNTSNLIQGGSVNPLVRADMTLMYYPDGGAVWSSSSISWAGSLYHADYDNEVARVTKNVLDMFVSGDALPGAPSSK